MGAVKVLQELFPQPGQLQFIYADLGDAKAVLNDILLTLRHLWDKSLIEFGLNLLIALIFDFSSFRSTKSLRKMHLMLLCILLRLLMLVKVHLNL